MNNEKYLELQAWNLFLNGPRDYNVEFARRQRAPANAIYHKTGGTWATMFDLDSDHEFRGFFERMVNEKRVF